ncbi:hypothetical protein BDI4_580059 [Burkholderia diffusa]|nr:hypothetical protein BDI4_580059 [Burkholderia diffusa]
MGGVINKTILRNKFVYLSTLDWGRDVKPLAIYVLNSTEPRELCLRLYALNDDSYSQALPELNECLNNDL